MNPQMDNVFVDVARQFGDRMKMVNMDIMTAKDMLSWTDKAMTEEASWRMSLDTTWVLLTSLFMVLVIVGSTLLELGWTRRRNTNSALLQNLGVISIVGLFFWFTGFGFAFGKGIKNRNGFIGTDDIFLASGSKNFPITRFDDWQFFFVLTTFATMLFGNAVSERITPLAFAVHAALFSGFIMPVAAHWIFSTEGFFSYKSTIGHLGVNGVIDTGFATFHVAGGAAALAGLILVGKRNGRFDEATKAAFTSGNCRYFQVVGAFLLWAGYFGMLCGGNNMISNDRAMLSGRAAINLFVSAGAAGITTFLWGIFADEEFCVTRAVQGAVVGIVSVSSAVAVVEPWAAVFTGIIGAFVFLLAKKILNDREYDDTISIVAINLAGGFWGLLVPGIFGTQKNTIQVVGHQTRAWGFLYAGSGNQFAVQFFAALLITLWAFLLTYAWGAVVNGFGLLLLAEEEEETEETTSA